MPQAQPDLFSLSPFLRLRLGHQACPDTSGSSQPRGHTREKQVMSRGSFQIPRGTVKLGRGRCSDHGRPWLFWPRSSFPGSGKAGAKASMLGVGLIPGRLQGGSGQPSLSKEKLPNGLDARCIALGGPSNLIFPLFKNFILFSMHEGFAWVHACLYIT